MDPSLPLHHDMGLIGNALTPLFLGAETTLMSPLAFLQKPLRWLAAIDRFGATTSGAPNFAYDMVVRAVPSEAVARLDLSRWTMAYCGAEPVRAETLARFAAHVAPAGFRPGALYPCYGLAEATLMVTGGDVGIEPDVRTFPVRASSGATAERPSVACGRPHGATRVLLLAEDGVVREGEVGEICVAGPGVSPGFWDPQTGMAVPDPERRVEVDGIAYLRTGDLGRWVDGALHVVGRLKNMIILRGANHYAEDIEATVRIIEDAGGPLEAAVFAAPGTDEGFSIVCERAGGPEGVEPLKAAISRTVAEAHGLLPADILVVPPGAIARTPSGKLMREETRRQFQHLLTGGEGRP
ncbi:AMP-binding protein [Aquabacter sp. L1I39]|uniref:AMP-binding protein n=1 Tax=Aquabacter sp. L1I39 TaxID=2820278 RepID=UPI001ADB24AA|nr:AMP-binding protein [Aquabacter sp. L1I39]QTL02150.1 AMP-binding protein [Aquabacter sp. L1I39]